MADAATGRLRAAASLSRTVLRPDVRRVLEDYRRLESDEARARYADHFLSRTSHLMEDVWPTFYELLKRVEEQELYSRPGYLADDRVFSSFREYFEFRAGRPFEAWAELESTYHYAKDYAPGLLEKAFAVARNAYERVTTAAAKAREALDAGAVFNEGSGPIASANLNIVQISEAGGGGNRASYLARRIARDRPDMLPAMAAGEYKSIHDAAVQAGIVPRTKTVRIDDPQSCARTLRAHMTAENLAVLVSLLTSEGE